MTRSGILGLCVLLVVFAALALLLVTVAWRGHDGNAGTQRVGLYPTRLAAIEHVGFLQRA